MIEKIFKILFWSFFIWLIVRTFLFQTYHIPSASMHGNLFEGDYVVINKLAYGARVPLTPLSFKKNYLDLISWPYIRLPGYSEVKRNDVVAFNYSLTDELPIDLRQEYIKRCVALPGDTLTLINGIVNVNHSNNEPQNLYYPYTFVFNHLSNTSLLMDSGIDIEHAENNIGSYYLSAEKASILLKTGALKSITLGTFDKDYYHPSIFPNYPSYKWNLDNFGPLYIPREDDSITLTTENLLVYQRIIERFEKTILSFKHDSVFVNGNYKKHYTFKQNYYFMVGDNRHNSIDSRHWGFIPESHIIGKASVILYSKKEGWNFLLIK
ncbi:MAG: Signal peptidase [Bacteroidetes bacterium]|nr:Signal peptidase [Bacteroidota bacterium]